MSATTGLVYDDLQTLPDDHRRRELIGGDLLVTPAPGVRHQMAVGQVFAALHLYAERHGHLVLAAPLDVLLSDIDVVEPDVVFVLAEHLSRLEERFLRGAPDLVVEVSTPSTRRRDLGRKRDLYERMGVAEYWFVDMEAANVLVHRLGDAVYGAPTIVGVGEELTSAQLPGLRVAAAALLRPRPS